MKLYKTDLEGDIISLGLVKRITQKSRSASCGIYENGLFHRDAQREEWFWYIALPVWVSLTMKIYTPETSFNKNRIGRLMVLVAVRFTGGKFTCHWWKRSFGKQYDIALPEEPVNIIYGGSLTGHPGIKGRPVSFVKGGI